MNNNEEYVLLFTWRLVFPRLTDFIDPDTKLSQGKDRWAIYSLAYHIGGISSPEKFKIELCKNYELVENLKSRFGTDLELPKGTVGTLERIDVEGYGTTLNLYGPEIYGKIQQIPELSDFVEEFNARYSQAAPVSADPAPADPAAVPADPGPKKKRKRTRITPDLIKRVVDTVEQNPLLTNEKLAKLYGLSDEVLKPGKPLRLAVDRARPGNLGRHAAKPDKPFNDDN